MPKKGYRQTEKHKQRIKQKLKGRKVSEKCLSMLKDRWGKNNPNWKGGRSFDKDGYVCIQSDKYKNGWKFEHRLVMEKHVERELTSDEIVHHINNNKSDNRIKNLLLTNFHDHKKLHKKHKKKNK